MVTWISQRLGPEVQNVTTIDEAEKIITDGKVAVLAFLDSLSVRSNPSKVYHPTELLQLHRTCGPKLITLINK